MRTSRPTSFVVPSPNVTAPVSPIRDPVLADGGGGCGLHRYIPD